MNRVLFWDPACQAPYDTDSVRDGASGGAEATLSRIADAIGASVVQHNRTVASGRYLPPKALPGISHVVVNRDLRAIPGVVATYPRARVVLWLHDRVQPGSTRGRVLARSARLLASIGARVVCVSDWQRGGVQAVLQGAGAHAVPVDTIYNPVPDALVPDGTPVDLDKLVFFSSPNKGLSYALDAFVALRRRFPSLRLVVGDPGYRRGEAPAVPGVFYAGPRSPRAMHADVRGALCTFFPNFVVPETFGLVFAESLALGTPVLTHDCGAAREVIGDPRQLLPVRAAQRAYGLVFARASHATRVLPSRLAARLGLFEAYGERIAAWRAGGRPQVAPDPRFRLSTVAAAWRALLAPEQSS